MPVGEIIRRPSSKCALPLRPSRLEIGVILFACVFPLKDWVWKDSFLRMRWWTIWYRWRKKSVLREGGGSSEAFSVDL